MAFDDIDAAASAATIEVLGKTVSYTAANCGAVPLKAIVDLNVRSMDALYGDVGERRNEISFLKTDAPDAARGDTVTFSSVDYTLQDLLDDDGTVMQWSLRYA